ncbi:MAG: alpha/beta hydrolase [Ruminococcaceae bacterium]|nr:alpha/beta hydrolase [Oscillospiraceae bacterium]
MIKRVLKFVGKALLIILILSATVVLISYINHRIRLINEEERYSPIGRQVEVNLHLMNVYSEGSGNISIVFMSGGGTCSPALDFKTICSKLSDKYKVIVIEKAGYGFSEDADVPRDIDSILSESREALILSGHDGPYILAPHSMSGIEALYWAQKYPDEVSAIIGLDMSVPKAYEELDINLPLMRLFSFASKAGITRLIPGISEGDAVKYGTLSEEEKNLYSMVFFRRTLTTAMMNEIKEIKNNAKTVSEGETVDIPVLIFSSNGEGTGFDEQSWNNLHTDFINSIPNGEMIKVDSPHYLHNHDFELIAEEMKIFISELED